MGKRQRSTFLDVRFDDVLVEYGLVLIRCQYHDNISTFTASSMDLTVNPAFSAFTAEAEPTQPDNHIDAGILQVVGMGMTLSHNR